MYNNTNFIRLHEKGLRINNNTVKVARCDDHDVAGAYVKVKHAGPEHLNDFYRITLAEDLVAGSKYYIYILFNSKLNEGLQGYYRSSYIDARTKKRRCIQIQIF